LAAIAKVADSSIALIRLESSCMMDFFEAKIWKSIVLQVLAEH
jgi:hypothetical protein